VLHALLARTLMRAPHTRAQVLVQWKQPTGRKKPYKDTWEELDNLRCTQKVADFLACLSASERALLRPGLGLLLGGPPCQGVSGNNRKRVQTAEGDENTRQTGVWVDLFLALKPRYGLMENVCDLINHVDGVHLRLCMQRLLEQGYQLRVCAISASSQGCPQTRLRMILMVAAPDQMLPPVPLPTFDCSHATQTVLQNAHAVHLLAALPQDGAEAHKAALQRAATLGDCLSDLPVVGNDETRGTHAYATPPQSAMQVMLRQAPPGEQASAVVTHHQPAPLTPLEVWRLSHVAKSRTEGQQCNWRDIAEYARKHPTRAWLQSGKRSHALAPPHYMVRQHPRAWHQRATHSNHCFLSQSNRAVRASTYRRYYDDMIVPTVTTSLSVDTCGIRGDQDRRFTTREVLRIQGFPDSTQVCGTPAEQQCQAGNAIPPPVSYALGLVAVAAARSTAPPGMIEMTIEPRYRNRDLAAEAAAAAEEVARAAELNAYVLKRAANIKRNRAKMEALLGIKQGAAVGLPEDLPAEEAHGGQ
jgi:site-specific DNA-cytosine methylase